MSERKPAHPESADEREYQKGRAEGRLRAIERELYGAELIEQWDIDADLAAFNRGEL